MGAPFHSSKCYHTGWYMLYSKQHNMLRLATSESKNLVEPPSRAKEPPFGCRHEAPHASQFVVWPATLIGGSGLLGGNIGRIGAHEVVGTPFTDGPERPVSHRARPESCGED